MMYMSVYGDPSCTLWYEIGFTGIPYGNCKYCISLLELMMNRSRGGLQSCNGHGAHEKALLISLHGLILSFAIMP